MQYFVLTGDIVDSTSLSSDALDAAMQNIETAGNVIAHWTQGVAHHGFARRSGDAWQFACAAPHQALRAALFIRAYLLRHSRDIQTRIALAQGDGHMPGTDPNAASGPPFTASGRMIDNLDAPLLMGHASGGAAAAATLLADQISQGWTQAQARALCEMLPPGAGPRREAAKRLGISRQAVDQALWAAGYPALAAALQHMEQSA